jgi:NAD-dependent SIR2 family protein deacetylase
VTEAAASSAAQFPALDGLRALAALVSRGNLVVLSGAGLSTESGIPDYRGPTGQARRAEPMSYQAFTASAAARQRYWARSHLGWRNLAGAAPNAGHHAVAELERRGLLTGIITQNVDGLHQAAGAQRVIELHGSIDRVVCLCCGRRTSRAELDARLRAANPAFRARVSALNPDGDAVISEHEAAGFQVVGCRSCGGILKPDVVFFGENVPPERVARCRALVASAGALLVLGSSLSVMSGYRFVRQAARSGVPVAIINQGPTRGDGLATVRLEAPLGAALTTLVAEVSAAAAAVPPAAAESRA